MANSTTRHGQRAEGMTLITFPCSKSLKQAIVSLAAKDNRTASAWLRIKLQDTVRRSRSARKAA